jgi:hypothetical protein
MADAAVYSGREAAEFGLPLTMMAEIMLMLSSTRLYRNSGV